MADYFSTITSQLGIAIWLLVIILIWEMIWTGIAMWKSARRKHLVWFIVFFLVNLLAIPEILYIFVFSKMKGKKKLKKKKK
jgi:4-amino-4-deoxy-L-arabinose transferase-like glycosyltransferase